MPRFRLPEVGVDAGRFFRAFGETGVAVVATGIVLVQLDRWDGVRLAQPAGEVFSGLALAAAGLAGAAAVAAMIGTGYRRLAAPLGLYALVLGPVGMVDESGPGIEVTRLVLEGCFLLLLSIALWGRQVRWLALVAGAVVASGIGDAVEDGLTGQPLSRPIVVAGWWAIAIALVVVGARRREPATWRIGIGFTLIAMAHLEEFTASVRISWPDLEFGVLRVIGLFAVFAVLSGSAIDAVRTARRAASASAEREHEIRNALTGLSGVGHLLGSAGAVMSSEERAQLGSAMQAELERVRCLLDDAGAGGVPGDTGLGPLLTGLAVLRSAGGERIEVDVRGEPRAAMPTHALAQVLTNLLANCARHAAGSRVRVGAESDGDFVTITVTDEGPGLRRGGSTAGAGMGLAVSARLLAGHGGTLKLASPSRGGCTAEIRLPAAARLPESV